MEAAEELIRGWIECAYEDIPIIKEIISEHWETASKYQIEAEFAALYGKGWGFP